MNLTPPQRQTLLWTAVALLLIEHRWALPLETAIQKANGTLLAEGLVPRDLVAEVEELVGA